VSESQTPAADGTNGRQSLRGLLQPAMVMCRLCGRATKGEFFRCGTGCRGEVQFDYPHRIRHLPASARSMWDFGDRLPVRDSRNIVSLGEGMTPLLSACSFPERAVFWKNEGANPTGSQKDRAVSVAISVAREHGFERVVTASTGSVGLACAAYCARADLPCVVLVPSGTPVERLRPILAFGAKVVLVDTTFEHIEQVLATLDPLRWYQASTIQRRNCYQSEGPKTIAYEIVLQLGHAPDWLVVPVGGGGTLFGIWKGFDELQRDGLIDKTPRMIAVQGRTFNFLERVGIVQAIDEKEVAHLIPDERAMSVLRNLKHGFPPDAHSAMRALQATAGHIISVTDEEALAAQLAFARCEGIFCEPSAAVTQVAVSHAIDQGWVAPRDSIVGIITGSGMREPGVLSHLQPFFAATIDEAALERIVRAQQDPPASRHLHNAVSFF
jgi:threonine synthase